jgi:hypothetical protein
MEYQNLLIAPDLFDYLSRYHSGDPACDDVDLKLYKNNLKLKRLILDKEEDENGIYKTIKNIIRNSSDFAKDKLEIIIEEFIQSKRIYFSNSNTNIKYVKNKNHNYYFNLAKSTDTKIINSQVDILLYKNQITDFEILSIEDFNDPGSKSFLFNQRRDISLSKNDIFNIYEVLRFYWINTESLIIEDDYLRKLDNVETKREGQFPKLIRLIETCKNLKKLIIRTPFSDIRQNSKEYLCKNDFEQQVLNQTGIRPTIEDKKMGERHYYTDFFHIHLGKGLDFFNLKDYRVWRPTVTITIRPLENKANET